MCHYYAIYFIDVLYKVIMSAVIPYDPSGRQNTQYNHNNFEAVIMKEYMKTPDYAIRNVKGFSAATLGTSLVIPYSGNTILDRVKRVYDEKLYIVFSDRSDKIAIAITIVSMVITIAFLCYAFYLGAHQEYVFTDPDGEHAGKKQTRLRTLNTFWSGWTWFIARLVLAGIPSFILLWRIFKRTTYSRDTREKRMLRGFSQRLNDAMIKELK